MPSTPYESAKKRVPHINVFYIIFNEGEEIILQLGQKYIFKCITTSFKSIAKTAIHTIKREIRSLIHENFRTGIKKLFNQQNQNFTIIKKLKYNKGIAIIQTD